MPDCILILKEEPCQHVWVASESLNIQILPPCFGEISIPFENFKETNILTLSELFDSKINILMELFNSIEWQHWQKCAKHTPRFYRGIFKTSMANRSFK